MLTLTMMADMLESGLSHFYPLQFNTDGLTFIIKRSEIDLVVSLFDKLTKIDDIPYEYVEYKKMVIRDVNSYIAIDINDNVKSIGAFQDYNDIIKKGDYHKDLSAMIIPKALKAYFVNNIPIEETINKENNIYEFCYGNKGSNSYKWMLTKYNPENGISKSELFDSRFVRYFAGGTDTLSQFWIKGAKEGTIQAVQAQTPITLLMNVPKTEILDLDKHGNHKPRLNSAGEIIYRYPTLNKHWYITECYKIINQIEN